LPYRANVADGYCYNATLLNRGPALERNEMSFELIVWIVVVWVLGALVAVILLRMAGDQDRAARHMEKELHPFSDVTITQSGER
jgi:hypothetical protein